MPQPDLFPSPPVDDATETPVFRPTRGGVIRDLERILSQLATADRMPWNDDKMRMYRCIVPQMTNWLPADEASLYCQMFDHELARLGAPALPLHRHVHVEPA